MTERTADVVSAERIAAGDHAGCACVNSAAAPAAIGLAIEVPDRDAKRSLPSTPTEPSQVRGAYGASTSTPGADTSGRSRSVGCAVNVSSVKNTGPREENGAMTSAGRGTARPGVLDTVVGPGVRHDAATRPPPRA